MFTGIIENTAIVREIEHQGTNVILTLESPIASELYVDQSVAHNGACLTITEVIPPLYKVTLIQETIHKTHFSQVRINDLINIERAMPLHARLDGHFVTGHIDTTGIVEKLIDKNGSWELIISHPENPYFITIPKGSIAVNGISLTIVDCSTQHFSVHIIPYTYEHTNIHLLAEKNLVNIEFDLIGKYIAKMTRSYQSFK